MVKNKDKDKNNSSNSLVFGQWPQAIMGHSTPIKMAKLLNLA